MTIPRSEISKKKMKMLDIYIQTPLISNEDMAKAIGVNNHTVAKWKAEWEQKLSQVKLNIEQQITQEIEKRGSLFQRIVEKIQGSFS